LSGLGSGALSGLVSAVSSVSGLLTGTGALTGSAVAASVVAGVLIGSAPLTGTASDASSISGTLTGSGALTGTVAAASSVTGTLASGQTLSGSAASVSSVTGNLTGKGALGGAAYSTSTITASIQGLAPITGAASSTSGATGVLIAGVPVAYPAVITAKTSRAVRITPSAPAIRIAKAPAMSTNIPIRLEVMREGMTDTRGLDMTPALQLQADTIVSIGAITVVRRDGTPIGAGDLTITPSGTVNPWVSANAAGLAGQVANWWQSAGPSVAAAGPVDYQITATLTTAAGRVLPYDAYQMVTPTIG
jgi:hypothetical protein